MTPKPWPNPNDYCEGKYSLYEEVAQVCDYQTARAEAALDRLRLAVEALKESAEVIGCGCACAHCGHAKRNVEKALQAIGDLPK